MLRLFGDLKSCGDSLCVIDRDDRLWTYSELIAAGDGFARQIGDERQLIVLEIANSCESIAAYVGLVRAGHVALLVAPGSHSTDSLADQFEAQWICRYLNDAVSLERRPAIAREMHPDLAVLLSTSGSTGSPKLIRLSHANLTENARSIADYLDLAEGERAITSLPPFYSYGLSVIHSHLLHGHALILTEASVAQPEFWERVARHRATSFAGVPHSFDLLAKSGFLERRAPSLRYFTQAGGKLAAERVREFGCYAQENGQRFYVMYGQTEASPRMAYIPPKDVLQYPDCVGRAVPGGKLSIEPLAEPSGDGRVVGELVYSGPNVMMGYALEAADLAKPQGPDTLRTGDLAVVNMAGYFQIVGRMSRFAKLFGLRIGLDDLEQRLMAAGFHARVTGDDKGLVITTTEPGTAAAISDRAAALLHIPRALIKTFERESLPLLPTGKPDYRVMLAQRDAPRVEPTGRRSLRAEIRELMNLESIKDTDSFVSLGGDSLSFVEASMLVEQHLGRAPDGWERMSFAELERPGRSARPTIASVEPGVLARTVAILLVLFHHVSERHLDGAAFALMVAAGANFARFQTPQVLAGRLGDVLRSTLLKIVLPYFLVISLIFFYVGDIHAPHFLLISNFTDGLLVDGVRRLTIYWYIETYIDIIVALAVVLSLKPIRSRVANDGYTAAWIAFAIGVALRTAGEFAPENPAFPPLGPTMMFYVFALGWLIFEADGPRRKALVAVAGVSAVIALPVNQMETAWHLIVPMILFLLYGRRIPVGARAAQVITVISSASLYIYIMQPVVLRPAKRLLVDGYMPLEYIAPVMLAALLLGVGVHKLTVAVERRVSLGAFLQPRVQALQAMLGRRAQR